MNRLAGSEVVPPDPVPPDIKQRVLSSHVDAGALAELTDLHKSVDFRAHMSLLQLEGAGTWLHAIPNEALGTKVAPHLFVPMLQRRLRMPVFDKEYFCPLCDTVMDIWGDHALTCACDRVVDSDLKERIWQY